MGTGTGRSATWFRTFFIAATDSVTDAISVAIASVGFRALTGLKITSLGAITEDEVIIAPVTTVAHLADTFIDAIGVDLTGIRLGTQPPNEITGLITWTTIGFAWWLTLVVDAATAPTIFAVLTGALNTTTIFADIVTGAGVIGITLVLAGAGDAETVTKTIDIHLANIGFFAQACCTDTLLLAGATGATTWVGTRPKSGTNAVAQTIAFLSAFQRLSTSAINAPLSPGAIRSNTTRVLALTDDTNAGIETVAVGLAEIWFLA